MNQKRTTMTASTNATTVKTTFSRTTSVSLFIAADAAIVWALLTQASDYPRWNPAVISLEGEIRLGQKIRLRSSLDPKRVFTLRVKELQPERRMVWGDGKGNRIYTLETGPSGTKFSMSEKIGGLMFPLYAKYIPPFGAAFDQFARALKSEAEKIAAAR